MFPLPYSHFGQKFRLAGAEFSAIAGSRSSNLLARRRASSVELARERGRRESTIESSTDSCDLSEVALIAPCMIPCVNAEAAPAAVAAAPPMAMPIEVVVAMASRAKFLQFRN
jgi:hypothetical protein